MTLGLAITGTALLFMRVPSPTSLVPPMTAPTPIPAVPPISIVVNIDNWQRSATPTQISDKAGKLAEIEAIVLSNDFSWAFQSHTNVERHGEATNVANHLLTPGISAVIAGYADVVAVGAASSEGAKENGTAEDDRASRRADQLQLWIKEYIPSSKALYALSIGHYNPMVKADKQFSEQRKIVIIGVIRKDDGIDLNDALKRNLGKVPAFPFNLGNYSKFELSPRR